MKTFRIIGLALMAVLLSVNFSACSSSDDEEDNGRTTSSKRLVKMTVQRESRTITYDYSYDSKGRVVRKEIKWNGNIDHYYVYSYMDNLIVQKYYYESGASGDETLYTLENGLVVSEKNKYEIILYTYENGYLATKTYDNNKVYKYNWNNGNLKSIEHQSSGGYNHKKSNEYTNYAAPQGFVTLGITGDVIDDLGPFYGKTSKNLPSKFTEDDDEVIIYDWTLKDGLPVQLVETEKDVEIRTTITTFEWE